MKRLVLPLVALVALASPPVAASAHPLGNFTINRYSELDVLGQPPLRRLRARPGRDPDLPGGRQAAIDAAAYGAGSRRTLHLTRRRQARALVAGAQRARLSAGAGRPAHDAARGAASPARSSRGEPARLSRRQLRRPARLEGDRRPRRGRRAVGRSSAPRRSISDGLLAYPKNLLQSPLDVTVARPPPSPRARPRLAAGAAHAERARRSASAFGPSPTPGSRS